LVSFDVAHDRVLVARSGAISIIDLAAKQARDIGKVARGHAALVIPGTDQIAVTSGQDNSLRLYDAGDGHEVARVPWAKIRTLRFGTPAHAQSSW
jgi:hypothetical protein